MVQLTAAERALVDDLLECLELAIERDESVNRRYANKTKLQKLLCLAIEEFDLPITYSWYLAGSVVPDDPVDPTTLSGPQGLAGPNGPSGPAMDTPADVDADADAAQSASSPTPGDEGFDPDDAVPSDPLSKDEPDDESDESVTINPVLFADEDPTPDDGSDDDPEEPDEDHTLIESPTADYDANLNPAAPSASADAAAGPSGPGGGDLTAYVDDHQSVVDFYTKVLPGVWHQQTMRFLQHFYRNHAPSQYRSLYLTSIHLRTHLLDAEDTVRAHLAGDSPGRSLSEIRQNVELEISDLHYHLQANDQLARTLDPVMTGTTIIEDAVLMLEQAGPDELTPAHLSAVQSLQEFFYYHVWRLPCLIISRETATGPQAEHLRAQRDGRLTRFADELDRECTAMRQELSEPGLVPAAGDVPLPKDETLRDQLADLTEEYLQ
jgi:hypothetical protein